MAPEEGGGSRRGGRLSRSADFDRVFREGFAEEGRYMVLYAFRRPEAGEDEELRLGLSVGRKVGGAVERNKVKRVLREAFGACSEAVPAGHDYVIVARPELMGLVEREGTAGVGRALQELLGRATASEAHE